MSLELNADKWWGCTGDELWTMNLRRPTFVAQDDECHRRGGKQALINNNNIIRPSYSSVYILIGVFHDLQKF